MVSPQACGEKQTRLALMKDEKLLMEIKPHYLAFYDMYLIWAWIIILSLVFITFGEELSQFLGNPMLFVTEQFESRTSVSDGNLLKNIPLFSNTMGWTNEFIVPINDFMRSYTPVGLWISVIFASAMAISVLKIEWKWIGLMVGVGVVSMLLALYLEFPAEASYYFGIAFSILGISGVQMYRDCHRFYITDRRIVTEVRFTAYKRNELSYDKINNLILEQGILGRMFDFGTIIPVTASGLGMGSDFSAVTLGAAGQVQGGPTVGVGVTGGRTVQTPRVRSMYGLYGVQEPEKVQRLLSEHMHAYVEAPYLRKMTEQLDELKDNMKRSDSE
ncbi:MAG: PH domain-containing protein [Candidatus Altiarchaeota archaeon]